MTAIRLKGGLNIELSVIGLEEGDIILDASIFPNDIPSGAAYFTKHHNGYPMQCVVYPENYDIVTPVQKKIKENERK